MKKIFFCAVLTVLFSGCFLVISHEPKEASMIAVHLLPPKVDNPKAERLIDAQLGFFPFIFDVKHSQKNSPVYFDYSHLQREFFENASILFEGRIFTRAILLDDLKDQDKLKNDEDYRKVLVDRKLDVGVFGKVTRIELGKKFGGWQGALTVEFTILSSDGAVRKTKKYEYTVENITIPDNVIFDYQAAIAVSTIFNRAYSDIVRDIKLVSPEIEMHRLARETVKGRGIITVRKASRYSGKARLLIDSRIRVLINDYPGSALFGSKSKDNDEVKKHVEEINKTDKYKLTLTIKDVTETVYPFKVGKVSFDPGHNMYVLTYIGTKEYFVPPGKGLLVATFTVPQISEVITKGVYIDVNAEKGLNIGFNLVTDTKHNYVDMVFVK